MPKSLTILLITITILVVSACNNPSANHPPPTQRPIPVTVASVQYDTLIATHTSIGTLIAAHRVQVYNQEQGKIIQLSHHEGDHVEKGAVLVRLDEAVVRAELIMAMAKRRQAELDVVRIQKLFTREAASEDEVAQKQTALELARAEENLQQILLNQMTISAPFAGVISERLKDPGDVVPANTHILSLIDPSDLIVNTHVSELLLAELKKNDTVKLRIDALGEKSYKGRIRRIHPVIETDTRQGVIEVALDPVPQGALPGQLVRLTFHVTKTRGLVIPFASVHYDAKGAYVYRIDDHDIARRISVNTGLQLGDKLEILEGLTEGEQVVLSGLLNMKEGEKVNIIKPQAQLPAAGKHSPQG
jgi:membrane fusion protein (multidrug efflux system)